jgi:hypothetical protein
MMYNKAAIDWTHDGSTIPNVNPYDCDGPPAAGLSAADYLDDECYIPLPGGGHLFPNGTANEYDYQRFFWDLITKAPPLGSYALDVIDIADVIGAACSTPWDTSFVNGSPTGPVELMSAEAAAWGATWDDQAVINGVTR